MKKGRKAGGRLEVEWEEEILLEKDRMEESEIVGRLKVLEHMTKVTEMLLHALAWKSLRVGAGQTLECLAVNLSAPLRELMNLAHTFHHLEDQLSLIWNMELDVLKEF